MKLDYVLALKTEDFLERRLQTCVYKLGLAKSIHHARVLIKQRHIRVGKQIVNVPSYMVRLDSQKHIDFALTSPFGGGRPGRVRRKKAAAAAQPEPHTQSRGRCCNNIGPGPKDAWFIYCYVITCWVPPPLLRACGE